MVPIPRKKARVRFVLGVALAVTLLFALAEGFLRWFPPQDLHPYLGEGSPLHGIYVADTSFGVGYRDWETFRTDNEAALSVYLPFAEHPDQRKVWAFFGNSFVQAPGMLGDQAKANVRDRKIFTLGRNELFHLRLAQIKLLLENGLKPERVFVAFMPVDTLNLGQHPLSTQHVTTHGALTYKVRPATGIQGWLVDHSRLALASRVRRGRHFGNPAFDRTKVYHGIQEPLLGDLQHLFAELARVARTHNVPVTILLIPAYHQIIGQAPFGFQDQLIPFLREQGFDIFDPREAFCTYPEREGLFIPDKHFNELGNRILLTELLRRLQSRSENVREVRLP